MDPDRLAADLARLGVRSGATLMVHASLRRIGPVVGGASGVVAAIDQAVGSEGSWMMILSAADVPEWTHPPTPAEVRLGLSRGSPFDPARSPALAEVGHLAEAFRRSSVTLVNAHPLGRFGARGRLAAHLLHPAPRDDYYGPGSPLERLCQAGGRVLRLGADPDTVTLLHHAEYLAPLPKKRRLPRWVLVSTPHGPRVEAVDALDDANGIVDVRGEDYFARLLKDYLATGRGSRGLVGRATSELLDARDLLSFAVTWMAAELA